MKNKNNIKLVVVILIFSICIMLMSSSSGCTSENRKDIYSTLQIGNNLVKNQPTPSDIDYSLERYNLIRRAYWVNGQREKANMLQSEIQKPFGYIVLFSQSGAVISSFVVDGKVSGLNSFLTPDSEEYSSSYSEWLPDVDGSYGYNDNGIFFFTPDGKYIEWSGEYLYSDIPFEVQDPVVTYKAVMENE